MVRTSVIICGIGLFGLAGCETTDPQYYAPTILPAAFANEAAGASQVVEFSKCDGSASVRRHMKWLRQELCT